MSSSDSEAGARSLLLVGGQASRVTVDPALRPRWRDGLVVQREGADPAAIQEQGFQPVRRHVQAWPLGYPVGAVEGAVCSESPPRGLRGERCRGVHVQESGELSERRPSHGDRIGGLRVRSEEHTSELQSLMRISYAVFCLNKKK